MLDAIYDKIIASDGAKWKENEAHILNKMNSGFSIKIY